MEPAKQSGIPTSFLVDGTGTIAWIGHPMEMDEPLAAIVAGKWDIKAEAAKAKAAAELEAKLEPIMQEARKFAQAEDWTGALKALDGGIALGDGAVRKLAWFKYNMHIENKDLEGGIAFIDKNMKGALKDEGDLLNAIAWGMVDPEQAERLPKKDFDFALRCSMRSCELVKGKEPQEAMMLDTLATVYFAKGENAKAVEVQTRVVAMTKGKEGAEEFAKKLETYKAAPVKG